METDAGVFDPIGFGFSGTEKAYIEFREIAKLLEPIEASELRKGGGGADDVERGRQAAVARVSVCRCVSAAQMCAPPRLRGALTCRVLGRLARHGY